jgi:predicted PurR-regulated permease PerM
MLSFVGSQLTSQLDDISTRVGEGINQIREWANRTFGITDTDVDRWVDQAGEWVSSGSLTDTATAAGLTATHIVAGFFLALFTLYFFLYDGPVIWGWVVRLFPRGAREKVHSSGLIAWGQISAFSRATLAVAAVDAIGIGVGAAILGVPFASGIALLVFFGAFIPVVGAAISGAVAVLLALVALGPIQALIMLGIVIGVQQVEAHLLQPLLVGRVMRIHPLAVILAIAAGIVLAGIIGGLIAVPTVAVLNAVGHHLLDSDETAEDQSPDEPVTADDVLTPAEEATAEAEAEHMEEKEQAASDQRLPGHS